MAASKKPNENRCDLCRYHYQISTLIEQASERLDKQETTIKNMTEKVDAKLSHKVALTVLIILVGVTGSMFGFQWHALSQEIIHNNDRHTEYGKSLNKMRTEIHEKLHDLDKNVFSILQEMRNKKH